MTAMSHTDPLAQRAAATAMPPYYAGFWRRLMAAGIDGVIMLAIIVGITFASGGSVSQVNNNVMVSKYGQTLPLSDIVKPQVVVTRNGPQTTVVETMTGTVGLQTIQSVITRTTIEQNGGGRPQTFTSTTLSVRPSPLAFVLLVAIWLLYTSALESSRLQATFGKVAMFIRVADEDGRRLTLLRSLARNALKLISAIPFCIGFLMAGWTARKQALHDILAKCTVAVAVGR